MTSGTFLRSLFFGLEDDLLNLIGREGFYIGAVALYGDEEDFFLALGAIIFV